LYPQIPSWSWLSDSGPIHVPSIDRPEAKLMSYSIFPSNRAFPCGHVRGGRLTLEAVSILDSDVHTMSGCTTIYDYNSKNTRNSTGDAKRHRHMLLGRDSRITDVMEGTILEETWVPKTFVRIGYIRCLDEPKTGLGFIWCSEKATRGIINIM
jgi:hypothetical protein